MSQEFEYIRPQKSRKPPGHVRIRIREPIGQEFWWFCHNQGFTMDIVVTKLTAAWMHEQKDALKKASGQPAKKAKTAA